MVERKSSFLFADQSKKAEGENHLKLNAESMELTAENSASNEPQQGLEVAELEMSVQEDQSSAEPDSSSNEAEVIEEIV